MRLAIVFPLLLAACAGAVRVGPAGPDPNASASQNSDSANKIVVYRASEFGFLGNVATSPGLTLNGDAIGTCRIGTPAVLRVPDGTWTIGAISENGNVNQDVTVANGTSSYIRCGVEPSPSFGPKPVLMPVSAEVGSREAGR